MSADKFDKDIESLYLQRKQQIKAPHITFEEVPPKKKYRIKELFSILALGGVASFGILAVINHLAHLPEQNTRQMNEQMTFVEVIDVEKFDDMNNVINMTPPKENLKVKKSLAAQPTRNFEADTTIQVKPDVMNKIQVDSTHVNVISLVPNRFNGKLIKPTFKVMPTLKRNTQLNESGSIKLSYKVAQSGKTHHIKIVTSNVHKDLERSAKKALSQWRYAPKSNIEEEQQVEFQFNK